MAVHVRVIEVSDVCEISRSVTAAGAVTSTDPPEATIWNVPPLLESKVSVPCEVVVMPGAQPIVWQWWITRPRFDIRPGGVTFTAELRYRVDGVWSRVERTVPAKLQLNGTKDALRLTINPFSETIRVTQGRGPGSTVEVDVARYAALTFPIRSPELDLARLDGTQRTLTGAVRSADVQYLDDRIRVNLDVTID